MPRPSLLLLDEPSAGLSPKVLLEVFEAIQQVRDQEGVTILMVEQNAMEALRISDRAYVLSMGSVALTGNARELMHDPQVSELYLGSGSPETLPTFASSRSWGRECRACLAAQGLLRGPF